jgi:hypothetical protein
MLWDVAAFMRSSSQSSKIIFFFALPLATVNRNLLQNILHRKTYWSTGTMSEKKKEETGHPVHNASRQIQTVG